jgi:hypothetical protein
MDKKELLKLAWHKGRTYAERSGMSLEQTLKALKKNVKDYVKFGLTKEEVVNAFTKGYNNQAL